MDRNDHCTHPEQAWCDCDWCRVVRAERKAYGISNSLTHPNPRAFCTTPFDCRRPIGHPGPCAA